MRYGLGISQNPLTLGFGSVYFMSSICRLISLDSGPICIILKGNPKESRGYNFYHVKDQELFGIPFKKGVL